MSPIAGISEPASELERLITGLSRSGLLVCVFGVGWRAAHLTGAPARACSVTSPAAWLADAAPVPGRRGCWLTQAPLRSCRG